MICDKALFSEAKRRIINNTKLRQKLLQTPNISLSESHLLYNTMKI